MPITWIKTETKKQVVFVSSNEVTVTIQKLPVTRFDMQIAGPYELLAGTGVSPLGDSTDPDTFIANFIRARQDAGETVT